MTFRMDSQVLREIAGQVGTPVYVYHAGQIRANYRTLASAFPGCGLSYAVKANSNLAVLRELHALGAGFDVVSWGEAVRALSAGAPASSIVFAGVGKRDEEIAAALDAGVGWINVESSQELLVVDAIARKRGRLAQVALRLNPAVDPHTHQYLATGKGTSKFGIDVADAMALVAGRTGYPGVRIAGVHAHIGSQLFDVDTYAQTMGVLLDFVAESRAFGADLAHVDMGGGFGVDYRDPTASLPVAAIAARILPMAAAAGVNVQFEPGRFIVADAGVLLTRVLYTKNNGGVDYAVVDAAMNDLMRPALYQAFHGVEVAGSTEPADRVYEVVGPICESGDWLAHGARLPLLNRGDLLQISHAGAYGMSMASNYNTRGRAAEVLIDGADWRIVRRRETVDDLLALER